MDTTLLRPIWRPVFRRAWILILLLFVLLGGLRFYGLFGPSSGRVLLMLNFTLMWFLPVAFFSRPGRSAIGIKKPHRPVWFAWGSMLGLGSALLIFVIGYALYGQTADNWYVSVRDSYLADPRMAQASRVGLFFVYTVPAMLFSPLGEELFFRGMLHESVNVQWGARAAVAANALAFGAVHLLHHGVRWDSNGLHWLPVSGALWFLLMVGVSWLFTLCRQRSGSIWPAVVAHSAFNLSMYVTIFWALL